MTDPGHFIRSDPPCFQPGWRRPVRCREHLVEREPCGEQLAHPGVAPTSLLAARPELGRERAARGRGLIALLSRVGVMGTPASAALPALLAVTAPDAGGRLFGPRGPGHLGGPPAPQRIYSRLRSEEDARRVWEVSQEIAGVAFPTD